MTGKVLYSGEGAGACECDPAATQGCLASMSRSSFTKHSLSRLPIEFINSLSDSVRMCEGFVTYLTQFILMTVATPFVMTASLIEGVVRLIFSGFYYGASLIACNDETKKDLRNMGLTLWKSSLGFDNHYKSCAQAFIASPIAIFIYFSQMFGLFSDDD